MADTCIRCHEKTVLHPGASDSSGILCTECRDIFLDLPRTERAYIAGEGFHAAATRWAANNTPPTCLECGAPCPGPHVSNPGRPLQSHCWELLKGPNIHACLAHIKEVQQVVNSIVCDGTPHPLESPPAGAPSPGEGVTPQGAVASLETAYATPPAGLLAWARLGVKGDPQLPARPSTQSGGVVSRSDVTLNAPCDCGALVAKTTHARWCGGVT